MNSLFSSFMMAGFECTSAKVSAHERLDLLALTEHRIKCRNDYQLIKSYGINTVREGLSWAFIDQGYGNYDFSTYEELLKTGKEEGIQQVWDLNHFDYPDYLDPFSNEFPEAFGRYAKDVVRLLRKYIKGQLVIAPINEISFFAWISADQGKWAPFKTGENWGLRFKSQLVKAAIKAMESIWEYDTTVRFIHIDPFMRRVTKEPANQLALEHTEQFNSVIRFQAWDMIAGLSYPELGGNPKYLDLIGINYYIHNQEWVLSRNNNTIGHQMMSWNDPARISLAELIETIYNRYKLPMVLSETGSYGNKRGPWWERTLQEVSESLEKKLPLLGVCAYPTLDRPKTLNFLLPQSGIFDFDYKQDNTNRIPHEPSLKAITRFLQTL